MAKKTASKTKATKSAKAAKKAPSKKAKQLKEKKLSAIDAAAQVLAASKEPLNTKEMIEAMAAKSLWTSPGGKTPHATLYSAISSTSITFCTWPVTSTGRKLSGDTELWLLFGLSHPSDLRPLGSPDCSATRRRQR